MGEVTLSDAESAAAKSAFVSAGRAVCFATVAVCEDCAVVSVAACWVFLLLCELQ